MYFYRVTKYSPKYRKNGVYTKEEWTSVSDVDKVIDNKRLTKEEYVLFEDKYVEAIGKVLYINGVDKVKVTDFEYYDVEYDKNLILLGTDTIWSRYCEIKEQRYISFEDTQMLSRLILRECIWAKLTSSNCFVHFGYDYYMYFGSHIKIVNLEIDGLYLDEFTSPYL